MQHLTAGCKTASSPALRSRRVVLKYLNGLINADINFSEPCGTCRRNPQFTLWILHQDVNIKTNCEGVYYEWWSVAFSFGRAGISPTCNDRFNFERDCQLGTPVASSPITIDILCHSQTVTPSGNTKGSFLKVFFIQWLFAERDQSFNY